MINIAYRITCVPERIKNALIEASSMEIGTECIYLDSKHQGNIWNKFRVYQDIIEDGNYTHLCMNDDDLIIPKNFTNAVNVLVNRFPDCIFTFYNSQIGGEKPLLINLRNHHMSGASCVIPVKILKSFLNFYNEYLTGFKWDDTSMSIYAMLNDIDVILVVPKLIDVIHVESTLPMRKGRCHPCNKGYCYQDEINVENIRNAPLIATKSLAINTHLPKGHIINKLIQNKINKIKGV